MDKKIRVVFFIYQFGAGGAARTLLNILNHLDQHVFEPILVTLDYNGSYERFLNENIQVNKLPTKRLRSAIIPFAKFIHQQKVDIVFSTIPNYNIIAILARLFSFTKAITIVREAAYLQEHPLKLRVYGYFYRFAHKVISLSQGVKKNLVNHYNVKSDKIEVIYNPVDLSVIADLSGRTGDLGEFAHIFQKNKKTIVTAGRFVKEKDQKTLIKAFAKVRKQIPCQLILLGEGELEHDLKALAQSLEITDDVYFIGFQQNPYVFFKHADVFVLSSLTEGFGHVLVEALATKTPVVSTNCKPGAQEILQNGTFGQLCEVGNEIDLSKKIYEILTVNDNERAKLVQKGYLRAKQFDAKKITKQYERIFIETIERNRQLRDRRR